MEKREWLQDTRTMGGTLDAEIIVIFGSTMCNIGVVVVVAVLLLVFDG